MTREALFFLFFLTPSHALAFGEFLHLALQVNDYVSDVVLCWSISEEKSKWSEKRQFIEGDLASSESHSYTYTAPPVDGNETLVPLVGFGLQSCNCSSASANSLRILNAQESASWEVPLFLMQVNTWETAECECPGSRYSASSPELLNNQYMYDSMTGDQKKKFCNPSSYYDPLFKESDLGVMFVFSVLIVVCATFTNALTVYTRLKVSFDVDRQQKEAENQGFMLNSQEQQGVMTTNIAITTVFIGLTEDTPQLILSCFFAAYKVADGGMECLQCVRDGTFCKLPIDPTADLIGMISSNPVAFYSVISSIITIFVTASTIAYGVIETPAEGFNFMGVSLMDPDALQTYTYGCFPLSKKKQKVFVGLAFPAIYILALLFPVNAVVYFKIRHMLHKDWTPSLVGFILGLIAILFFFYWLVPAAAKYIYKIAFNNNLTEIKKVASGLDPSNVDLEKMKQAAPYLNDVNIDALMEMKGVDKDTLMAVKGIDVPTLRAVKGISVPTLQAIQDVGGIDAAQIKAAKGVDISWLQAIGDSAKELDAASMREATEMKKMAGDLGKVKRYIIPLLKAARGIRRRDAAERVKELQGCHIEHMQAINDMGKPKWYAGLNVDFRANGAFERAKQMSYRAEDILRAKEIFRQYLSTGSGIGRISRETLELVQKIGPHRLLWHERNH